MCVCVIFANAGSAAVGPLGADLISTGLRGHPTTSSAIGAIFGIVCGIPVYRFVMARFVMPLARKHYARLHRTMNGAQENAFRLAVASNLVPNNNRPSTGVDVYPTIL